MLVYDDVNGAPLSLSTKMQGAPNNYDLKPVRSGPNHTRGLPTPNRHGGVCSERLQILSGSSGVWRPSVEPGHPLGVWCPPERSRSFLSIREEHF